MQPDFNKVAGLLPGIQSKCRKKIEKKLWLILFFMLVATYHFYEKAHRKMCTTIVLYFFNLHTFKTKSKIFLIFEIDTKTSISYKKFSWK